jgi:hypothetical protein
MNGWITGSVLGLFVLCSSQAHAHFKLLKPASWLNEDDLGAPQKGSPCGPGNTRPFIGDDKQPIPSSGARTTFHAGETITVEWQETIYHPGYFRISIADTSAAQATTDDFPDPALTDAMNCHYDRAAVMTTPHDDVLADGLFMADAVSGENRSLMQRVKLPDEPCENCTLQVVQVMEGHPASSCFYFHCAEIEILPHDGAGAAGTSGPTTTPPASSDDGGGCSIAHAGVRSSAGAFWFLLGVAWALWARTRLSASRSRR